MVRTEDNDNDLIPCPFILPVEFDNKINNDGQDKVVRTGCLESPKSSLMSFKNKGRGQETTRKLIVFSYLKL